jgi:threonine/homoserine/homoserine lactone efflux protein
MIETLLKGAGIGLAIAAPVGPVGLLCIRRTLARGPLHGFVSGLGAAAADGLYGVVAAFGLSLAAVLIDQQTPLRIAGGALLLWIAWRTWRSAAPDRPADAGEGAGLPGAFLGTFALTVTNPATILSFAGVIAALGPGGAGGGSALVVGVVLGSAAWWLGLSLAVGRLRARVTPGAMRAINRISALVLAGFAVAAVASLTLNS